MVSLWCGSGGGTVKGAWEGGREKEEGGRRKKEGGRARRTRLVCSPSALADSGPQKNQISRRYGCNTPGIGTSISLPGLFPNGAGNTSGYRGHQAVWLSERRHGWDKPRFGGVCRLEDESNPAAGLVRGRGRPFLGEVEQDSFERLGVGNSHCRDQFPPVQAVGIKRVPLSLHEVVPLRTLC